MVEIIAEGGLTHQGGLDVARRLAEDALNAEADIFKIQTYLPDKLLRPGDPDRPLLEKCALSWTDTKRLARHCEEIGIEFLSTPGEVDSLKFLVEECGIKRIKIGSDDLTYVPLIDAAYATKLPVILSTGMATSGEVRKALPWNELDHKNVTVLHCTSLYPCPPNKANLLAIKTLEMDFPYVDVGFSDHTITTVASIIALSLGALIIEKHICPSGYEGPDWEVSLTPLGFRLFVNDLRASAKMLGNGIKRPSPEEALNIYKFRKGPDGFRGIGVG